MGGYQSVFGLTAFVPPSPNAIGHTLVAPGLPCDILWDSSCDTGSLPAKECFEFIVDGTPETPASIGWTDSTTLTFGIATGSFSTCVWRQITKTAALHGVNGSVVKLPQSQTVYP